MKRIEQMSFWERAYVPEIVRGLSVTGYHFWRNLSIHILHAFGLAKPRVGVDCVIRSKSTLCAMRSIRCAAFIAACASKPYIGLIGENG